MKKDSRFAATCIDVSSMPSMNDESINVHYVPLVMATEESFKAFGKIVCDYEDEEVIINVWPAPGWRPVEAGTGNEGGITEGDFVFQRKGAVMTGRNFAVDGHYITGWFADPASATENSAVVDTARVIVREANYHPDGGQVFYPAQGTPFVALLAKPGDDISPEDFIAFYCDGSFGIQIFPGIWHQPVFPVANKALFKGKQSKVHACIACDFIEEFGCYLSVPLC